jgi:hypothetical protein
VLHFPTHFQAVSRLKECNSSKPILAYGKGRSYGYSCLNQGGTLIDTSYLNKVVSFDKENGTIPTLVDRKRISLGSFHHSIAGI